MELLLATLLAPIADPAPGLFRTVEGSRQLGCASLGVREGVARYPGRVSPEAPRGDYVDRRLVVCEQRALRAGLRRPRVEAVLGDLELRAQEIASAAGSLRPDLQQRTWLVEVHDPSPQMVTKIGFAVKNALIDKGVAVSDRTPKLAIGDLDVLTRMEPGLAYPAACKRYAATHTLGPEHVLLSVITRDPRETLLHAGTCADGNWTWLR